MSELLCLILGFTTGAAAGAWVAGVVRIVRTDWRELPPGDEGP